MHYVKINSEFHHCNSILHRFVKNDGKQTEVSASDDLFEVITV